MPPSSHPVPQVLADLPVSPVVLELLQGRALLVPWETAGTPAGANIVAIYTYGHSTVDAALLDRLPAVRVISNFGVGVDHIDVAAAAARGIPVGNTPGILDGATADLAFALLLAAGRRVVEGDRYARDPVSCATIRRTCWAARCTARRSASSAWDASASRWRGAAGRST